MAEKKKKAAGSAKITVQYYRSSIGFNEQQKLIVQGLGLRKLNATRELTDTPSIRGMVAKVPHLVRIVE
jgi:large subunit ribosomal protein L30